MQARQERSTSRTGRPASTPQVRSPAQRRTPAAEADWCLLTQAAKRSSTSNAFDLLLEEVRPCCSTDFATCTHLTVQRVQTDTDNSRAAYASDSAASSQDALLELAEHSPGLPTVESSISSAVLADAAQQTPQAAQDSASSELVAQPVRPQALPTEQQLTNKSCWVSLQMLLPA